jgi:2,3-dihydro-2,3-dihydroxybenzoate dehydrogenase
VHELSAAMDPGLDGRIAIVTGAAGGIGAAVARRLAHLGARVVLSDLNAEEVSRRAEELRSEGKYARSYPLDIARAEQVESVVARVEEEIGPIDLLVHAAAIFASAPLLDLDPACWERIFTVNVKGTFFCLRAVGKRMAQRKRGAVVMIGSQSAKVIRPDQSAYGSSKAAGSYMTKCLGLELAASGVRCNVVHPGVTETPMARALWDSGASSKRFHLDGSLPRFRIGVPIGKVAEAEEVANAAVFLASDLASHITMADIVVDGGQLLLP